MRQKKKIARAMIAQPGKNRVSLKGFSILKNIVQVLLFLPCSIIQEDRGHWIKSMAAKI